MIINSIIFVYFDTTAMPPASSAGDHGPIATSQHCDNRPQPNTSQTAEQAQQQNLVESHTSPSPSAKKGSFFKKNVEDGMDRYYRHIFNFFVIYLYFSYCQENDRFINAHISHNI